MSELRSRFLQAVADQQQHEPELLPAVLSSACVAVLPVSGAGLCLTQRLRVPLGASDDAARRAEKMQTTIGDGPCLAAMATGEPLAADLEQMRRRWPVFAAELAEQTPYRATVSLPLAWPGQSPFGALDLYSYDSDLPDGLLGEDVRRGVVEPVVELLLGPAVSSVDPEERLPVWVGASSVAERMRVWEATGLVVAASSLSEADATLVLRGYAYSRNQTLDEVALELATRRLPVEQLLQTRR